MIYTRNVGADLLPFVPRPSHPGARLRAVQNARARREREAPPPDEAFTAERLRRDLATRPVDVILNDGEDGGAATREFLRNMGWTDARLDAARAELHSELRRRVHPPADPTVTAAGGAGRGRRGYPIASRTPAVVDLNLTASDRRGMLANVAAARRAGYDPDRRFPGWRDRVLASGAPDRPVEVEQGHGDGRSPRLAGVDYGPGESAGSGRPGEAGLVTDVYRTPRHAPPGDGGIRRRIDVTDLFTRQPGDRMTARDVHHHTVGSIEQVRELLEELVGTGWLRQGRDEAGHVAYWREKPRRD